jgi:hypothetical protein
VKKSVYVGVYGRGYDHGYGHGPDCDYGYGRDYVGYDRGYDDDCGHLYVQYGYGYADYDYGHHKLGVDANENGFLDEYAFH